ncbi:hypothetical protein VTL71DRAFT_12433 [Oculimacula yallundae]|uniref:Heterokaryon incompatibility domain-containing protein n=1 Tax=Oculimacula yallundae TaxID=86028 RepID=A0ABR4CPC9_9HELO
MKSSTERGSKRKAEQDSVDSNAPKRSRVGESSLQKLSKTRLTKELVQSAVQHGKDELTRKNTYVYPSLKEGHGQDIRILIIERGENGSIRCKLVPCSLPKSTSTTTASYRYVALSYFWSDGDPIHAVKISNYSTPEERMRQPSKEEEVFARKIPKNSGRPGQQAEWRASDQIFVRTTFYQALERFRREDVDVYMWIDALCIDQDDVPKELLSVWLGDGDEVEVRPEECFGFLTSVLDIPNLGAMLEDLANRDNLELR